MARKNGQRLSCKRNKYTLKKTEKSDLNAVDISLADVFARLSEIYESGVTELSLHDASLASDSEKLCSLAQKFLDCAPDMFVSVVVEPHALTKKVIEMFSQLYSSLEIPVRGTEKNGTLLFDKKLFSSKAAMLNSSGTVFGFEMEWAVQTGDTFRQFRNRLDFSVSLYPNHIDFPQFEKKEFCIPKSTGIYSSKDIDFSRGMAFACLVFYTYGRAVPWFLSVIKPLKISPSSFFADFEEWQLCNNCSFESGFKPAAVAHKDIEKMQLAFIREKYEEKKCTQYLAAAEDLIKLNGAFSRVAEEGEESVVKTSYNPDDILSPYAYDLAQFCDNVTMEECSVKVFAASDSPDYKIL